MPNSFEFFVLLALIFSSLFLHPMIVLKIGTFITIKIQMFILKDIIHIRYNNKHSLSPSCYQQVSPLSFRVVWTCYYRRLSHIQDFISCLQTNLSSIYFFKGSMIVIMSFRLIAILTKIEILTSLAMISDIFYWILVAMITSKPFEVMISYLLHRNIFFLG